MKSEVNTPTVLPSAPPSAATGSSLDRLVAEQGVRPLMRFEDLFGAGRDLWTDEEFASHLEQLRATRREEV